MVFSPASDGSPAPAAWLDDAPCHGYFQAGNPKPAQTKTFLEESSFPMGLTVPKQPSISERFPSCGCPTTCLCHPTNAGNYTLFVHVAIHLVSLLRSPHFERRKGVLHFPKASQFRDFARFSTAHLLSCSSFSSANVILSTKERKDHPVWRIISSSVNRNIDIA